jgi:hypothetical protein
VIVVLEGIQYDHTSLAAEQGGIAPQTGGRIGGLTPHLAALAGQGALFANAKKVSEQIVAWRKATILRPATSRNAPTKLYTTWL